MGAFEDMVNGRTAALADAAMIWQEQQSTSRAVYASAKVEAEQSAQRTLADACRVLQQRGVPTALAVTTAGPGGANWHYIAQALGWELQRFDVKAFLTIDGRISLDHERRQFENDFVSPTEVLARFEKATLIKDLVNPELFVPQSGRVVDLHTNTPHWLSPDRLVEITRGQAKVLWPTSNFSPSINLDFDSGGQVLVHARHWDTESSTPLETWLADAVARLMSEQNK